MQKRKKEEKRKLFLLSPKLSAPKRAEGIAANPAISLQPG
jgi:hypothetical protein